VKERRWIVDTTLRDGEQRPGICFRREDKLFIASVLDALHVHEIEAGSPCLGKEECDGIREIVENKKHSLVSVWSRMNMYDIKTAMDCNPDVIHIGAPVSYVQIYSKLKKNKSWVIKTLCECIELVLSKNIAVTVGFEDASRADVGFLIMLAKKLQEYKTTIRLSDTVGVMTPDRTRAMVEELLSQALVEIEIHVHNDLGMAVANSLEAAKAGAKFVDCTLFGIGERSGNCNFHEFVKIGQQIFELGMEAHHVAEAEQRVREWFVRAGKEYDYARTNCNITR
jgi:homocitrate synthase NifV